MNHETDMVLSAVKNQLHLNTLYNKQPVQYSFVVLLFLPLTQAIQQENEIIIAILSSPHYTALLQISQKKKQKQRQ